MLAKPKDLGQVWSPDWVADLILDRVGFIGEATINKKLVFEPSFGEGIFIYKLIDRIVTEARNSGILDKKIGELVDNKIHGIEYDGGLYIKTKQALISYTKNTYGLTITLPNLHSGDMLDFTPKQQYDFIVGNPPYVRIHNLPIPMREKVKTHAVATGTTDLYIVFYFLCYKWLTEKGRLGFIAPNSWLRNSSQASFRKFLVQEKAITEIIDFGVVKVFPDVSTYTCVVILSKEPQEFFNFTEMITETKKAFTVRKNYTEIGESGEVFNIIPAAEQKWLDTVSNPFSPNALKNKVRIQNGVATLGDRFFILDSSHPLISLKLPELYPVVKASTYKGGKVEQKILFPYRYDKTLNKFVGLEFDELSPEVKEHFEKNKQALEKRSIDKGSSWFWFGRSQAIQETNKRKLVFSPLVAPNSNVKAYIVPAGTVVYSGLFITEIEGGLPLETVKAIVESNEFGKYARLVGKNMSGGYKSINTKQVGATLIPLYDNR